MKFYEKLIILRKKALLSQEQLAEKLDVTRQTISKWELGQTKPDMDKLNAMSKLFEVDINILTNDELSLEGNKQEKKVETKKKDNSNRKIILYIVIIIFVASLATLVYRVGSDIKEKSDAVKEEVNKAREEAKRKQKELESKKKSFNYTFETYQGTESKTATGWQIDKVIQNNKTNNEHLVEVVFDGVSYGTDSDKIKEIKNSLRDFNGYKIQYYEISLDYDDNGYVNKVTIETR